MNEKRRNVPVIAGLATLAVTFTAILLLEHFHPPAGRLQVEEGASIEFLSATLWFASSLLAGVASSRRREHRFDLLLLGYLFIILGVRELDFHTRFTEWNMEQPIKYTKEYIPLSLRLSILALVGVPVVTAAILTVTRWRRQFQRAWREGRHWSRAVVWWIALMIVSRVGDKLSGYTDEWFRGAQQTWLFRAAEESLEFAGVVLVAVLFARLAFHAPPAPALDAHQTRAG